MVAMLDHLQPVAAQHAENANPLHARAGSLRHDGHWLSEAAAERLITTVTALLDARLGQRG
jgi:hypothetical protein